MKQPIILNYEEIETLTATSLKLYCLLVGIANNEGSNFYLPTRDMMRLKLNCRNEIYEDCLKELHTSGLITILNPYNGGKKVRRKIVVTVTKQYITHGKEPVELKEPNSDSTLHNIYPISNPSPQLPPEIKKLKDQCPILKDISDTELIKLSGYAPMEEIGMAICELANFNSEPKNVLGLFRSRFSIHAGRGTLNPSRTNPLWKHKSQKLKMKNEEELSDYRFYPVIVAGFTAHHIDMICKKLNSGEYVNTDMIPIRQLAKNRGILETHSSDNLMVKLKAGFLLVKISTGIWDLELVKNIVNNKRSEQKSMRSLSDSLPDIVNTLNN